MPLLRGGSRHWALWARAGSCRGDGAGPAAHPSPGAAPLSQWPQLAPLAQCLGSARRQPRRSGCPCLSQGTPWPSQPATGAEGDSGNLSGAGGTAEPPALQELGSSPCWAPARFAFLGHFVSWQGCGRQGHHGPDTVDRVAGGGRCRLPWSSLSARLRHTSAALGNSKLQPGLLLMFKNPEANGRRIISQINKGQRSGIVFFILLKSSLKAFLDNSPGCSAGYDVAVSSGVPGKGQLGVFNQFSARSVRPFVPPRPHGAGGRGPSPPGWR